MIQLIGPGGAGKTTAGAALAERLGARFVDLDAAFVSRHGDISAYLDEHGYAAYASANLRVFEDLDGSPHRPDVVALSSGFMTYSDDSHPAYPAWRRRLVSSPSTFVLLPSLQFEVCVRETVRRQLGRPFARSAAREEQVIRARLPVYLALPGRKIATLQPVEKVVEQLISGAGERQRLAAQDVTQRIQQSPNIRHGGVVPDGDCGSFVVGYAVPDCGRRGRSACRESSATRRWTEDI